MLIFNGISIRLADTDGIVGSVTDNHDKGERRYSLDAHKMSLHKTMATGSDKKKAKAEKKEARKKIVWIRTFWSIASTTRVITHPRTISWDRFVPATIMRKIMVTWLF